MSLIPVYDAVNYQAIPTVPAGGEAAGYTTGAGIAWPAAAWAFFPNALRICQDAAATDLTADVLDIESGAATAADAPVWFPKALANYQSNARSGQRYPCVYMSVSTINSVQAALKNAGFGVNGVNGPAFWLAVPGSLANAESIINLSEPFPTVGVQYYYPGSYDQSVFDQNWVRTVSPVPDPNKIPTPSISQAGWTWCNKCQGIFYGPNSTLSVCPAGGNHNVSDGSLPYLIPHQ